jgi:hypothetical protein
MHFSPSSTAGSSPSADNTTVDGSAADRRFDGGPISCAYLDIVEGWKGLEAARVRLI